MRRREGKGRAKGKKRKKMKEERKKGEKEKENRFFFKKIVLGWFLPNIFNVLISVQKFILKTNI